MNKDLLVRVGNSFCAISELMLDKQKAWHKLEILKNLHYQRLLIEELLKQEPTAATQICLVHDWNELQFKLQETWGFPKDAKFHKFWELPGCSCPKLDNEDSYPAGYYTVSGDCELHKHEIEREGNYEV